MSETVKYSRMKEILNRTEGMELHDKKDGNFSTMTRSRNSGDHICRI